MITALPPDAPWLERAARLSKMCAQSLRRHWFAWVFSIGGVFIFGQYFTFAVNLSPSLPYSLFIIKKGEPVKRNDFIAFHWHGGEGYDRNIIFVKIAKGVEGDEVTRIHRDFYVNGEFVGTAKMKSLKGEDLTISETGIIGRDLYYAMGTHKDSLDSRYAITGLISKKDLVGRAYAIF